MGIGLVTNKRGSGGSVSKVSAREVRIPGVAVNKNPDSIQVLLDNFSVTVAPGEVIYLLLTHYHTDNVTLVLSKFVFKNNHLQTVFSPANPIDAATDLIDINTQYTLNNILQNQDTQLIDLGELAADDVWDVLNAQDPAIDIQDQDQGYVVVQTTIEANPVYYLFLGDGGLYGLGELQSIEADFVELSQYVLSGFWQTQAADELWNIPGIGTINLTAYLRPLLGIELNKVSPFSRISDGGVTCSLRVLADGIFGLYGLLKDTVDLSATYDNMSHPNWGAVKKRNGKQELAFTLEQSAAQPEFKVMLNNPTGIDIQAVGEFYQDAPGNYGCVFRDQDAEEIAVFDEFSYPFNVQDRGTPSMIFDTSGTLLGYIMYYIVTPSSYSILTWDADMIPADNIIRENFIFKFDLYNR